MGSQFRHGKCSTHLYYLAIGNVWWYLKISIERRTDIQQDEQHPSFCHPFFYTRLVSRANEGKRNTSEERETRAMAEGAEKIKWNGTNSGVWTGVIFSAPSTTARVSRSSLFRASLARKTPINSACSEGVPNEPILFFDWILERARWTSGRSRGGARRFRPPYFRPNWGSKGRKKFCLRPPPPLPAPPIWRPGSSTVDLYFSVFLAMIPYGRSPIGHVAARISRNSK